MGIVYLHGNGGSGGASPVGFEIIGGVTRPAKPIHNTVWINTDAEITSYVLSATEPETPVEGLLWITIAKSSNVKFTFAVDNEWVTIYAVYVKQYIAGTWVPVKAKSYKNGVWLDWIPKGIIFDTALGGVVELMSVVYAQENASVTIGNNGVVFDYSSTSNAESGVIIDKPYDLTGYNKIFVEATITGIGASTWAGRFAVQTTKWEASKNEFAGQTKFTANNTRTVYELNVSALTGDFYIGTAGGLKGVIHKIWLE